ncbi:sodium-coupled monocarboxylate transporter 1 [Contarinia nasturtii]|uniref:sodium-coupled monocarboxylate transporter 1 n=1 Tax=Contarinia nasturtii TaxID=265458 RepID=UPI0012D430C7|nr:sodium-coupled monocarboxylate transporter 1 [Contarinia nasturtii]
MPNISDVLTSQLERFSWSDYSCFVMMLMVCIVIGIYFGFFEKKENTEDEYLVGNRNMPIFPVSLSLVASFISGITFVGLPTEVYSFGIQYVYSAGGVLLMGFFMSTFYLPVFHELNITSTYEYLEARFDRRLRMFGAIMFTIMNIGYLPIVIYVPALAFNQVTGVNVHIITPIVCVICVFYTCAGGIKAVVWTDVIQTISMFGALVIVAVKGTSNVGGSNVVFTEAWNSGRIEAPILDINPTIRHSIWSQVFGGIIYWLQANAVSQNMIQRYLALPTLKAGRIALYIFIGGVIILMCLCSYIGLLIYATYKSCDPLTTKLASARDQLLPLFVMDTLGGHFGLTGLFVAGVFSAALSSLSTCLNSMSAIVLEDFVKPFVKKPLSNTSINWIMRMVVVVMGIICVALVVVVQKMGTVLQLTMSLEAITNGPLLGIFTIGILLPWINATNTLIGGICGVLAMSWVSLNAQWAIASGAIQFEHKEMSISNCSYDFELTVKPEFVHESETFALYRISYMWYTAFGALTTLIFAGLGTFISGASDASKVDLKLIAPCLRKYIRVDRSRKLPKKSHPNRNVIPEVDEESFGEKESTL